tara:strand:- start:9846 stop:12059 length:2214 start_codon:yes stop_codon:yes gene_type:complete
MFPVRILQCLVVLDLARGGGQDKSVYCLLRSCGLPWKKEIIMGTKRLFNRTFDARPDRIDFRDVSYRPPLVSLPDQFPSPAAAKTFFSAYAASGMILDQGDEGACTGFGLAAVVNYLRWKLIAGTVKAVRSKKPAGIDKISPRMLYQNARLYDEWPGDDYDGSSCRGAMKGLHKHGVCRESYWPYLAKGGKPGRAKAGWDIDAAKTPLGAYYRIDSRSIVDMQAAILETNAIYVSADTHNGWDSMDDKPLLTKAVIRAPSSDERGGHAFALVGYTPDGFIVQNSWGLKWGYKGFGILPYEDWIANGADAWALALGAPVRLSKGKFKSPSMRSADSLQELAGKGLTLSRAPVSRTPAAVQPWSHDQVGQHVIIVGDNGRPDRQLVAATDAADGVFQVAHDAVDKAIKDGRKHVAIYGHGGLNSQSVALNRARLMGPWFEANGIHPLFVVWRTGFCEVMDELMQEPEDPSFDLPQIEGAARIFNLLHNAIDGRIEATARNFVGKPLWQGMKNRAYDASQPDGAMALLGAGLAKAVRGKKEVNIHLLGHSAGALLHGHFLKVLKQQELKVASCHLWAPACTVAFANEKYGAAIADSVLDPTTMYVSSLSNDNEKYEGSLPVYSKSLLYLISRALEPEHNTPILGMEARQKSMRKIVDDLGIFDKASFAVMEAWDKIGKKVVDDPVVASEDVLTRSAPDKTMRIKADHGSFDNNIEIVGRAIQRMLGSTPVKYPVTDLVGF